MPSDKTWFVIDDDADDQEIFTIALTEAGKAVNCVFANDGIEALEILQADDSFLPDFIFLDLNMPRMNGKQCLAEIKKIERLDHIPVVIYSTSSDNVFVNEMRTLGASDYLTKPSSIKELSNKLAKYLES